MMTLQQLDMNILLWIQEHLRIDALTPFWKVITFLGNAGWFWIVLAVALLVPKKTRRTGIAALLSLAVAILIGVPIGILTAVFITEVSNKKLAAIVQPAVELLAAIPSVIYGLLGLMVLNPLMYRLEKRVFAGSTTHQFTGGSNLLSAIIVLAIMILPTVINISVSSIRAVPGHLKSASLALGATHIQTIFKVMIPAARSGIMTGVVLGIGRALGEAMAINMVAGGSVNLPLPFNSVRFLTTQIVSEMSYAEGLHREVLFTVGLVLFIFIMIINLVLAQVEKKGAVEK